LGLLRAKKDRNGGEKLKFLDEVEFRPAKKIESRKIAELFSISSDGLADYIWSLSKADGEEILDVGQKRYENPDSHFSYKNCTIAEYNHEVIGMLVAFPMYVEKNKDLNETDTVLLPYEKLEEDKSFYICGVAVYEKFRGKGVGTAFMDIAEIKANELGLTKLSLIVFEENKGAKKLYDRLGYYEVSREQISPHPLIHYKGDAILMVKKI
jgi:ribosomal protein S18 acetylase RimI-like enzyme